MIPVRGVGCLEEQSVLHSISSRTNPQRKAELNGTLKRSIGKDGGGGERVVFRIWGNAEKSGVIDISKL